MLDYMVRRMKAVDGINVANQLTLRWRNDSLDYPRVAPYK
jgi:hypothetical protein